MPADGVLPPVLNLNCTPVGGESSSEHRKAPRATDAANLPHAVNMFSQMPTPKMGEQVQHKNFKSDWNDTSRQKRWSFIQSECMTNEL
jgi:hypothetical protein